MSVQMGLGLQGLTFLLCKLISSICGTHSFATKALIVLNQLSLKERGAFDWLVHKDLLKMVWQKDKREM